jgi:hypothetical protein
MTSRELVKAALEFASPPRIPRQLWLLPWASERYPHELRQIQHTFPDDIVTSPPFYREPPKTVGDRYAPGIYIDEWGCRFENAEAGTIGIVQVHLLEDWQDADKVGIPQELLSVDIEQVNAFCRSTDKFVLSGCGPRPFEQLQFIRTTENLLHGCGEIGRALQGQDDFLGRNRPAISSAVWNRRESHQRGQKRSRSTPVTVNLSQKYLGETYAYRFCDRRNQQQCSRSD